MRTLSVGRHERNNSIIAVEQLWFHRSQINYSTIINILRNPTRGRWFNTMSSGEIWTATVKDKKFWVDFKSKLLVCKSNNNYYYIALGKQSKNKQVKKACKEVFRLLCFALLFDNSDCKHFSIWWSDTKIDLYHTFWQKIIINNNIP
mgnify:CR=1 FL=1